MSYSNFVSMIWRKISGLCVAAGLSCFAGMKNSYGQTMAFHHLAVENGLSSSSVLSVMQDATGFMWFGTQIGLNRYDGTRFRVYRYNSKDSSSISSDNITSLFCDSRQALWVGTGGGLDKYDPKKDSFERIWINGGRSGNIFVCMKTGKGISG